MSGTYYAMAATGMVVIGDVLNGKSFNAKKVVGAAVATLGIAALDNVDDLIATRFGQLFLLSIAFVYLVPLLSNLGLIKKTGPAT